jgi:hypothetical protein
MLIEESSAGPPNTHQSGEGNIIYYKWSSIHNSLLINYILKEIHSFSSCANDAEQQTAAAARSPAYHRFA